MDGAVGVRYWNGHKWCDTDDLTNGVATRQTEATSIEDVLLAQSKLAARAIGTPLRVRVNSADIERIKAALPAGSGPPSFRDLPIVVDDRVPVGKLKIDRVGDPVERDESASPIMIHPLEFEPAGSPSRCKGSPAYNDHQGVYECMGCQWQRCCSCDVKLHAPDDPNKRDVVKTIARWCDDCRDKAPRFDGESSIVRTGGVVVRYPTNARYLDAIDDERKEDDDDTEA